MLLRESENPINSRSLRHLGGAVAAARRRLLTELRSLHPFAKVHGIGAPSRASVLLRYCGIDETMMPVTYEAPGSARIGHHMPGSRIEVRAEPEAFGDDQSEVLLLLSHHIADELMPKLRAKGFSGKFIVPLPEVRVIDD